MEGTAMLKSACRSIVTVLVLSAFAGAAYGALSAEEAARLGADLTPLGGEKAANAAGTIPAWDGGLSSIQKAGVANFKPGGHHPDPFASEQPLFKITSQNAAQYAANLTEGHKALLRAYKGTYFMNVY